MNVILCLLVLVCPMAASGQTVFFDDFEGNALLPHWSQPPPSHWEYNVSNSVLNVTALLSPSNPHAPSNIAIMGAPYAPQTDFRIDVRMGWEQGAAPHGLTFFLVGAQGQLMASFGYNKEPGFGHEYSYVRRAASGPPRSQSADICILMTGFRARCKTRGLVVHYRGGKRIGECAPGGVRAEGSSNMNVILCLLVLVCPMAASGQTVFFDDFEGNALLPHWSQPPPSHWEYNVSNSVLNVTALLSPSNPHAPSNIAIMGAPYAPQTDFRIDVRMGWEQGAAPHGLTFFLVGAQGQLMASFGYNKEPGFGPAPVISAGASGRGISRLAPPPGMHRFTITRIGAEFQFHLDGNFFATFPDTFGTPAAGVSFVFVGPFPGQLGSLHIDRIKVVPAPASLFVFVGTAIGCARRKRRAPGPCLPRLSLSTISSTRR